MTLNTVTQTVDRPVTGETKPMTMAAAITDAMDLALGHDPSVVMYGEDVGNLGGVYRITTGLQKKHGIRNACSTAPSPNLALLAQPLAWQPSACAQSSSCNLVAS